MVGPAWESLPFKMKWTWSLVSLCPCVTDLSPWRFTLNFPQRDCQHVSITTSWVVCEKISPSAFSWWESLYHLTSVDYTCFLPRQYYKPLSKHLYTLKAERRILSADVWDLGRLLHAWSLRGNGYRSGYCQDFGASQHRLISNYSSVLKMLSRTVNYWIIF